MSENDKKKAVIRAAKWKEKNPKKVKEGTRRYYLKNKAAILERTNSWRDRNKEKVRSQERIRYWGNREKILKRKRERKRERYSTEVIYRLTFLCRERIRQALQKNLKQSSSSE